MYTRQKLKTGLLYLFGFIAIGVSIALILWFVSILRLRTEYRAFCLEVNDCILETSDGDLRIGRGGEMLPLSREALDYYDRLLLEAGVTVASRRMEEPNEKSIVIELGENRLIFTNVEKDGSLIHLRWETPTGVTGYDVRSDQMSFMSMAAYYSNYARRVKADSP